MQRALANAVSNANPPSTLSLDPVLRVKDLERLVYDLCRARLEEQLNSQAALLTSYRDSDAAHYTQLKTQKTQVTDLQSQLQHVRLERDQAIGEKYVLQAKLKETSHLTAAADNCRALEAKLVETKLESAHLKMEIENMSDELETTKALLTYKAKEYDNLNKELAKVSKQRDLVLERYSTKPTSSSRGSETGNSARRPPMSQPKSAVKPHFAKGVFNIGLSSSRPGSCNSSVVEDRSKADSSFRLQDLKFE